MLNPPLLVLSTCKANDHQLCRLVLLSASVHPQSATSATVGDLWQLWATKTGSLQDIEDVDNATGAPVFQTDQDQTVQTRHCRLRLDMMHTHPWASSFDVTQISTLLNGPLPNVQPWRLHQHILGPGDWEQSLDIPYSSLLYAHPMQKLHHRLAMVLSAHFF